MHLSENKLRMLKALTFKPRTVRHFTNGNAATHALHPDTVEKYLSAMVEAGYIVLDKEHFHITIAGKQLLEKRDNMAESRKVVSDGTYRTGDGEFGQSFQRPNSDHSHINSIGGC